MDSKHKSARVQGGGGQKVTSFGVRLAAGSAPPSAQLAAAAGAMVEFSWDPPNPAKTNALWLVLVNPAGQWGITDNSGKNKVVIGDDVKLLYTTKQGEKLGDNKFQCALPQAGTYRLYFGLVASAENWCSDSDAGNVTVTVQQAAAPPKKDPAKTDPAKTEPGKKDLPQKTGANKPADHGGHPAVGSAARSSDHDEASLALAPTALRAGVKLQAGGSVKISIAGKSGRPLSSGHPGRRPGSEARGAGDHSSSRSGGGESNSGGGQSRSGSGGVAPTSQGALSEPRWSSAQLNNGDDVEMSVKAPGLDGRTVRFQVEYADADAWKPYATLEAKVQGGVAKLPISARHPVVDPAGSGAAPAKEIKSTRPAKLRFRNELLPAG